MGGVFFVYTDNNNKLTKKKVKWEIQTNNLYLFYMKLNKILNNYNIYLIFRLNNSRVVS